MDRWCVEVERSPVKRSLPRRLLLTALYHLTRRMPRWGRLVLRRPQRTQIIEP
jgi:hypothetical protein